MKMIMKMKMKMKMMTMIMKNNKYNQKSIFENNKIIEYYIKEN